MLSDYAIACAVPLAIANYIMVGLYNDSLDQFYLTSWKIFVGMLVVFNALSPLAFAMLRHRLGQKVFFWSVVETLKWTPMFVLFFGGISLHLTTAILCHFLSIKMEWTATAKELETSGFRIGLDKIFKDFKYMYMVIIPVTGGMIYLGIFAPRGYQITDFTAIVPIANQIGCHALLPVCPPTLLLAKGITDDIIVRSWSRMRGCLRIFVFDYFSDAHLESGIWLGSGESCLHHQLWRR